MADTPTLELRGVVKRFGDHTVLPGVEISVNPGEIVCLLGPSGCGKSTLARIATSLLDPDEGSVRVQGQFVSSPDRNRFMIFQEQDQIFPWKTALANVAFPLRLQASTRSRDEVTNHARLSLAAVGLEQSAEKFPHELSGGMRQRVALARALALRPSILVADEPFASVDASRRLELQDLLMKLVTEFRLTVLFVTHDIDEAARVADRVVIMAENGSIRATHTAETPRPRNPREGEGGRLAARFFDEINLSG